MAAAHRDLWRRYREQRDPATREALAEAYLWLVRYVAGRLMMGLPPHVDQADLEGHGVFGLLDALDRYDPDRGVRFETYAIPWIRGAMLAGIRAAHWAPALLKRARRLEQAYQALEAQLGREPTDAELADHMGITLEELTRRQEELSCVTVLSLDEAFAGDPDGEGAHLGERLADPEAPDPQEEAERSERREILARAVASLPEKERLVVTLYYHEGLTAQEIARILSVTPARISQLHSKAILRLRGKLSRLKAVLVS